MRKNSLGKTMRGLLWFLIMTGGVITFLITANWLPSLKQKGFARQYDSIEEAKGSLGLEKVLVPSYFPEGISWPPSLILAQTKPYKAVVMEFRKTETMETMLMVIESSVKGSDTQLQRTRLSELREETLYTLKGKSALLQIGICDNGKPCSRITWQDGELHCTVLLMSPPFELIKIAESMVH